jgi:hypothetical protein
VGYLRPPRFVDMRRTEEVGKPIMDFVARFRSPIPLKGSVKIKVNENAEEVKPADIKSLGAGLYSVELSGVELDAGRKDNIVRVWASNAESESLEPGSERVDLVRLLSPPEIHILKPERSMNVTDPRLVIEFEVRSVSPLRTVQIVRERHGREPVSLAKVTRAVDKRYYLKGRVALTLDRGPNVLNLYAGSAAGGLHSPTRVISYVPLPLHVVVDRLEDLAPPGKMLRAKPLAGEKIVFAEAAQGRVRLHGRLVWNDKKAALANKIQTIRVFVNGFQQITRKSPVLGDNPLERLFEVDLLLNRAKQNQVQVVVVGQEARTEFRVDCRAPIEQQRLHLLILAPRATDEKKVRDEVMRAIAPVGRAFAEIPTPEVLIGTDVQEGRITGKLFHIEDQIDLYKSRGDRPMNDVVMIYYQGGEAVTEDGNFFRVPGIGKDARGADIPCEKVVQKLASMSGAHVFLLDVERDMTEKPRAGGRRIDKIAEWSRYYPPPAGESQIVVMRHAWLGKKAFPPNLRLIEALRAALPRAAKLRDLVVEMGEIRERSKDVVVSIHMPETMEELKLGK